MLESGSKVCVKLAFILLNLIKIKYYSYIFRNSCFKSFDGIT